MKTKQALRYSVLLMFVIALVYAGSISSSAPSQNFTWPQARFITNKVTVKSTLVKHMLEQTVVVIDSSGRSSAGVILDSDNGVVLTCNHCVDDTDETYILETYFGERFMVKPSMIELYPDYDMAVIRLGRSLRARSAQVRRPPLDVGERIYIVGTPYGFAYSLSVGHISAVGRDLDVGDKVKYYQTDAAVNPGNSGGPWFDEKGYLVAISSRKLMIADDISFGIPIGYLVIEVRK